MPNQTVIIPLESGVMVEVAVDPNSIEQLSVSKLTSKLGEGFAAIRDAIRLLTTEVVETFRETAEDFGITEVEIEANLGIQAEGHVFLAKGTGTANLKVKVKIIPNAKSTGLRKD